MRDVIFTSLLMDMGLAIFGFVLFLVALRVLGWFADRRGLEGTTWGRFRKTLPENPIAGAIYFGAQLIAGALVIGLVL